MLGLSAGPAARSGTLVANKAKQREVDVRQIFMGSLPQPISACRRSELSRVRTLFDHEKPKSWLRVFTR